jgi:hypothetical protein
VERWRKGGPLTNKVRLRLRLRGGISSRTRCKMENMSILSLHTFPHMHRAGMVTEGHLWILAWGWSMMLRGRCRWRRRAGTIKVQEEEARWKEESMNVSINREEGTSMDLVRGIIEGMRWGLRLERDGQISFLFLSFFTSLSLSLLVLFPFLLFGLVLFNSWLFCTFSFFLLFLFWFL